MIHICPLCCISLSGAMDAASSPSRWDALPSVWRFPWTPPAGWLARVLLQKAGPAASSCLSLSCMSAPLVRFGGCGRIDSLAFQAGLSLLHCFGLPVCRPRSSWVPTSACTCRPEPWTGAVPPCPPGPDLASACFGGDSGHLHCSVRSCNNGLLAFAMQPCCPFCSTLQPKLCL